MEMSSVLLQTWGLSVYRCYYMGRDSASFLEILLSFEAYIYKGLNT